MALGGGNYTTQNKVIPGTYINFVSALRASAALSERGTAALALELDWGAEDEIFQVENTDFEKNSLEIFGYPYYADQLKGIRDLFKNAKTAYLYRLNAGTKAANTFGTAKYSGVRGNALKTVIQTNVEDNSQYDVLTYLDDTLVDTQTVTEAAQLKDTAFAVPKKDAVLEVTAGEAFTGGSNGSAVTGIQYQNFLDKIEAYSFHVLGCLSTDNTIKGLFAAFTKRMRDEMGIKFQTVIQGKAADYEGVINVKNTVADAGEKESSLVYWVSGACAGCGVNKTITNKRYDGEYTVDTQYKQSELEAAVKGGEMVFHKVGQDICVLEDINSLTSFSKDKNEDFASNQVIRVLDQMGNDIAVLFNSRYLGKVQNNEAGRVSFWNDIVVYNRELENMNAIENFTSEDVKVEKGVDKKSVVVNNAVTPVCAMSKLYMSVKVQ